MGCSFSQTTCWVRGFGVGGGGITGLILGEGGKRRPAAKGERRLYVSRMYVLLGETQRPSERAPFLPKN